MSKYFIKRFFLAISSLIIIATIVYFLLGLTKTLPISREDYVNNPEGYYKELSALGLDKPIGYRYLKYVFDILTGKGFGQIYQKNLSSITIPQLFFKPFVYTLWVTLPSFVISTTLGTGLGFLAGYKRGTWIDTTINIFVIVFLGIPSFVLAAIMLITGQALGLPTTFIRPEDGGYKQMILSIILPIIVLSFSSLASFTYTARNEVVSILKSNQVTIARAKGLDEWEVFKKHIIRNASIPLVSLTLVSFLLMLTATLIIETFFQIPGTSTIIINSVQKSEYNIVMFNIIFLVLISLILAIISDILYVFLDPRIKYESASEFKFIKYWKAKKVRLNSQTLQENNSISIVEKVANE